MKKLIINLTSLIIGYLLYTIWKADKYRQDEVEKQPLDYEISMWR
ncbi:hypothetical protein [Staphylococcus xylosus]|nr:hypothetical protein [Staphylococcus xylosus]